jgi:spermidine synthase
MNTHAKWGAIGGTLLGMVVVICVLAWSPPPSWKANQTQGTTALITPFTKSRIEHDSGYRCLTFINGDTELTQSCIHLKQPLNANAEYIRMMFALSLLKPNAKRVLILGIGGAALPKLFKHYFPNTKTDSVDIDPGIIPIAHTYFELKTDTTTRVFVDDARGFVRNKKGKVKYDMVFIDCFDAKYIPPHLLTPGFFQEVKDLLTPTGIIAANLFATHKSFDSTLKAWKALFPGMWQLNGVTSGNAIAFASPKLRWKSKQALQQIARQHLGKRKFHYPVLKEFDKATPTPTPKASTKALPIVAPLKRRPPKPNRACHTSCCGLARSWTGNEQRTLPNGRKQRVQWKGQTFAANQTCYARISIFLKKSRKPRWVEHYTLRFHKQRVIWTGILTEGKKGTLKTYVFQARKTKNGTPIWHSHSSKQPFSIRAH